MKTKIKKDMNINLSGNECYLLSFIFENFLQSRDDDDDISEYCDLYEKFYRQWLNQESTTNKKKFTPANDFHFYRREHECSCCEDKGYLEVTHDDGEYIEACQECDYFGIIGNEQDDNARIAAKNDGYKLTRNGKIKG